MAINPSGTRVYVGNNSSNFVSVIDTASNTVINNITIAGAAHGVAVNSDGSRVYASFYGIGAGAVGSVAVINAANNTVMRTIPVGVNPYRIGPTSNFFAQRFFSS